MSRFKTVSIAALLCAIAVGLFILINGSDKTELPTPSEKSAKPVIRLAQRNWMGFELNNCVARILLEEEMGFPVEIVDVDADTQFEYLSKGLTHAYLELWSGIYDLQKYIDEGTIKDGGPLGVVGKIGWFVPAYMLQEYPELANWQGLKDPKIAALFKTPAAGDKALLLCGKPDWGHDEDIVRNLGLPLQVEYADSEDILVAAVIKACTNREPLLFYFWSPHWIFAEYELEAVELPPYSEERYALRDEGGIDCGYPADALTKLFWAGLSDYAPQAYYFLKSFRYTTEDQITMLALVKVMGKTPQEAARIWIEKNEYVWREWIP